MNRLWILLVLLQCGLIPARVCAQPTGSEAVRTQRFQQAMLANYHYNFPVADSILLQMQRTDPTNTKTVLLDLNIRWWKLLSGANEDEIFAGLDTLANAKDKSKRQLKHDATSQTQYEYCAISVFQSRFKFYRKQVYPAFLIIYGFIGELKNTLGREDENDWFKLSSGIYNYYVDRAGDRYPYLSPFIWAMPSGDKETGLALLKQGFKKPDKLLKTECAYFLSKIYLEEEKEFEKALYYASFLRATYPENLFFAYVECLCLINGGQSEAANTRIEAIKQLEKTLPNLTTEQRTKYSKLCAEAVNDTKG